MESTESRYKKEANDTHGESVKQFSVASQAVKLMDEQKEEQRPWEETPDTSISVGATAGLSSKASRETVGVGTQGKKEAEEPAQGETTEGAEEEEVEYKKDESEVKSMPITKSKEAMLNGEDEVELVDEDNDIQILDMSMEEQPQSP